MFTTSESWNATLRPYTIGRRETMPQITVTADASSDSEDRAVLLRERVNVADFESHHFATQLVERLGWAVGDAARARAG
jgi:hypothetical protein